MLVEFRPLSRRRLLRGMLNGGAVAVGLPVLDCFLNENGTAFASTKTPLPTRFGTWFWGLGMNKRAFIPKKTGADFDLPEEIASLKDIRHHLNLFTRFSIPTDGNPNLCHYSGWVALRCGATPSGRSDLPGESLDLPIARAIGGGTPFRMLNFAATGNPRDSYSFHGANATNPPEISAVEVYRKLFGTGFADPNAGEFAPDPATMVRKSVLSGVLEESKDLSKHLGAGDRQRLDRHFTAVRELEGRLALQLEKPPPAPACRIPSEIPEEIPSGLDVRFVEQRHKTMTDLLVMALACNQTKVFNMLYSNSASSLTREGLANVHHNITHEELIDDELGIQVESSRFLREAFQAFAYFVAALASQPEGDGTLLDRMLVYAHSDNESAKTHELQGTPMFTVGNAGGLLKTGLHIDGGGDVATRLGYTVQRLMGLSIGEWGAGSLRTSKVISEILA